MIVTQDYGWSQLARERGPGWPDGTGWAMWRAVAAGLTGWEPFLNGPDDADRVGELAQAAGLAMPSVFVSGPLHDGDRNVIARMVATARRAGAFGTRMVAVYPAGAAKTDADLVAQAAALERLGAELRDEGMALLYHPEEPEMVHAAREFHAMLARTDKTLIRLCLDPDTIWRGAGKSMLAVLDVIALYGHRVDALHIRQSQEGVWAGTVGPGDIDWPAIAAAFQAQGTAPLLVLEHAYADTTPRPADPVATHRESCAYIRATFSQA
jgi:inosose dehydratase